MSPKLSYRLLVVLSVVYGLTLAVLGAFDAPVAPVAIIGALIIGGLWVLRSVLLDRDRT